MGGNTFNVDNDQPHPIRFEYATSMCRNSPMLSFNHTSNRKILTVALAVILGLGVLANSSSAVFVCSAACCMGSGASVSSHHAPKITLTTPGCCCTDTAAFPCEVTGSQEKQTSPPALLRAHQHDHRDLTADRIDIAATSANRPGTNIASTVLFTASILKVPIYLTTQTFLC